MQMTGHNWQHRKAEEILVLIVVHNCNGMRGELNLVGRIFFYF